MKLIPLTQGKFAQVDDEDFDEMNKYKWRSIKPGKKSRTLYAIRYFRKNGSQFGVYMHREILELTSKNKIEVDHKDNNGLNNQNFNLRSCTRKENARNTAIRNMKKSSIYKGVSWSKDKNKWESFITLNYKHLFLGRFNYEIEAAKCYNKAAIKYFKKFGKLNEV